MTHTWRAIAPPGGRVKYVRIEGVRWPSGTKAAVPEMQVAYIAAGTAVDVRTELSQIDSLHRSILRQPLEEWRFDSVQERYETLLKGVTDAATTSQIRERLNTIARQTEMARDARTIATILARSQRRDRDLALVRRRLAALSPQEAAPFDAVGLVQPSARKVEGEKVFALIGGEGDAIAYLRVPPGVETRGLLARRVGVRGEVHFDEHLHARVIAVRDLEPLDKDR